MRKATSLLAALLLIGTLAYAEGDWAKEKSQDGVEIYSKTQMCDGQQVVLLKMTNTNAYPVTVHWDSEITTEGGQKLSSNWKGAEEPQSKVTLQAGQEAAGDCSSSDASPLKVQPASMSSMPPLPVEEYEILNLVIVQK